MLKIYIREINLFAFRFERKLQEGSECLTVIRHSGGMVHRVWFAQVQGSAVVFSLMLEH